MRTFPSAADIYNMSVRGVNRGPSRITLLDVVVIVALSCVVFPAVLAPKTLVGVSVMVAGLVVLSKVFGPWWRERKFRGLRLAQIDEMSGEEFEYYVARLLTAQGFSTRVTQRSGDFGVDVIACRGDLSYAVQVKRYSSALSRTCVSDAVAGRIHYKCTAAMVVTSNYFTSAAKEFAQSTECELVDRDTLAKWIKKYRRD